HRIQNPTEPANADTNPVTRDTMQVGGAEGVLNRHYTWHTAGSAWDDGVDTPDAVAQVDGVPVRQVTGRNAPTTVNAIFFDRTFWDGRARRYFNGVNPLGELDPSARVLQSNPDGTMVPVRILIDNASLASQASGPPDSGVEMSWSGREFSEIGRKLLGLRPLAQQQMAEDDSVLGLYRDACGRGLDQGTAGYAALIRKAFQPKWWNGEQLTADGYTHMEANFSLFWGLAIMMYES
ncbi:MAG: cytochrome c peroxidase, partial [Planctomycetaceae bacterium]